MTEIKRILVMGCSGSGKSTLSRALETKLNVPAIHLDLHYWQPDWIEKDESEFRKIVEELAKAESWIMDGSFANTLDLRLPRAQAVIILLLPRWRCLWGAFSRFLRYRGDNRPDLPKGCPEEISFDFYRYIWSYEEAVLPEILSKLEEERFQGPVIKLKSRKDVKALLDSPQTYLERETHADIQ